MRIAELMHVAPKTVSVDATLATALVTLADTHVSGLPVVDARGRLVGVISTTDVLTALAEGGSPEERERAFDHTPVRDLMTPRPQTVELEDDVLDAARRMLYLEVRRLFVEADGKLVGVVSQTDIVGALALGKI